MKQTKLMRSLQYECVRKIRPVYSGFHLPVRLENAARRAECGRRSDFRSQDNVLLTASTASGKTEAAFFPILTLLDEDPPASVGVLYIAPLKALINDQFGRLTELCEEAGIPVTRWHCDVPQTQKAEAAAQALRRAADHA